MIKNQHNFIGKGSVLIELMGRLLPLGNVSALKINVDEEKKELQDFENAGGGTINSVSRIKAVSIEAVLHDLSPQNLALALRGSIQALTGANIADEAHNDIKVGSYLLFARLPEAGAPVIVKKGVDTLVEGTDYTRTRSGILITADGALVDGDDITVSYTALAENAINPMTLANQEYRLVFDGLNEAQSGRPVLVDLPRVKFNPAKVLDLIGDDFAEINLEGDVLKDPSRAGTGKSEYFDIRMAA